MVHLLHIFFLIQNYWQTKNVQQLKEYMVYLTLQKSVIKPSAPGDGT